MALFIWSITIFFLGRWTGRADKRMTELVDLGTEQRKDCNGCKVHPTMFLEDREGAE